MEKGLQAILAVVSAIIGLAILSVIIGRKSQAPQVIQASASALSQVISAAVNPVATASTNGNLGSNAFSAPAHSSAPSFLSGLGSALMNPFSFNPFAGAVK